MKARVKWAEARTFVGTSGTGHNIVLGTSHGEGGTPGPSPMELMLLGAAGCSAYDVVSILEKSRQNFQDVQVEVDADRADTDPKVFTRIHMHFIIKGRGVADDKVARAISLSVDKYCSASAMLAATATVTHDFEVIEAD
ncbi:OsmC family protein [Aliiroseovarius lamellibrachiae]|uniref:OsmC family protein n=1 Tax=Aliiroseovarius lamellibrachiae TaxID=1924933 RepID=UPI001BDFD2F9|nr:OsmC family protein [Aliiroseovarius lamellibrachiae]MBT2129808.1 OsmC family protein [Aliiroseovarius lamellibrachiae]